MDIRGRYGRREWIQRSLRQSKRDAERGQMSRERESESEIFTGGIHAMYRDGEMFLYKQAGMRNGMCSWHLRRSITRRKNSESGK